MAVQNGFDLHELDEFTRGLVGLAQKQYPKEAKQFIQKQGNEGRKRLRANTYAAGIMVQNWRTSTLKVTITPLRMNVPTSPVENASA